MRARLGEPSTWAMLAEDGGLVAGHAGYVPQPGFPGSAHLWQLFLRPPWWGTGIAAGAAARGDRGGRPARATGGCGCSRRATRRGPARFYEREGFEHTGWEAFEEAIGLVLVEYAREPLERR